MEANIIKLEPNSLNGFKNLSSGQWWAMYGRQGSFYKTIDHDKYAQTIHGLVMLKHAADWAIGRFVVELQKQIQKEYDEWEKKYYKDLAKKPEYTSAEAWFEDHQDQIKLSWRQAKRHRWVFLNVDFEFSDLGYKKNKTIDDFLGEDKETKRKFSALVKQKRLNETEVEKSLELFISGLEDEAREIGMNKQAFQEDVKEKVLKRIETVIDHKMKDEIEIRDISLEGKNIVIKCNRVGDAERVRDVLVSMEPQIKLRAYKLR